jgi:hypothetical protein
MFDGLFLTPAVAVIGEALASTHAAGPVIVVGDAALARALGGTREVAAVGVRGRAARRLPSVLEGTATAIGAPTAGIAAVIGVGAASAADGAAMLREWTRVVRDGGAVVMVDRGDLAAASRRALCAGLCEIEQRRAGRVIITSGLVSHFPGDDAP